MKAATFNTTPTCCQLVEWLGHVAWLLKPGSELIARRAMAGRVIHADDAPVPVLARGEAGR